MHYLVIKYINWWSCMHTSAVENNEWAIKKKKKTLSWFEEFLIHWVEVMQKNSAC